MLKKLYKVIKKHMARIPFLKNGIDVKNSAQIYGRVRLLVDRGGLQYGKNLTINSSWKSNLANEVWAGNPARFIKKIDNK